MSPVTVGSCYCVCVTWRTPNIDGAQSGTFTVGNLECTLQYCKGRNCDCDCRLYLLRLSTFDKPLDVFVQLIIGTEVVSRCRTTYPVNTTSGEYARDDLIWKGHDSKLSKVIADFDRQELLFKVTVLDDTNGQRTAAENFFPNPTSTETNFGTDSLSRDLRKLLDPEDWTADVVLRCGDREFKAHRCLLTSRSEVFASMLRRSDMLERGNTGRVEVRGVEPGLFELFVRYLYTGKLPGKLTSDEVMLLYEIGDRYRVDALKTQCGISLKKNLTPTNACDVLLLADRHGDQDLKEGAIAYMLDRKIHLRDDVWLDFSTHHMPLAFDILNRFCRLQTSSK